MVTRYVMRSRIWWIWAAAAVIWPAAYIWLMGGLGSTPVRLGFNLAVIPVGPILYGFIGAQMTDLEGQSRAREILRAWPTQPLVRTLGHAAVLTGMALVSAVTVTLLILVGAPPAFWSSSNWVLAVVTEGIAGVGLTAWLWLTGGFLVGQFVRGIWKPILMTLVPAFLLIGSQILSAALLLHPKAAPWNGMVSALQVAPFSWLAGRVSSIWGYGPYEHLFWVMAFWVAVFALFLTALAGRKAFGRARSLTLGAVVLGLVAILLGRGLEGALMQTGNIATYGRLANSYHRAQPSPVRLVSAAVTADLTTPNQLTASIVWRFVPKRSLRVLRVFLNPALRMREVRLNGRIIRTMAGPSWGWNVLKVRLSAGVRDTLRIWFQGNPALWGGTVGGPSATALAFVGSQGWLLPGGDWYPLVGRPTTIPWHLRLKTAGGTDTATSLGIVRGAGAFVAIAGRANNLSLLGGHLGVLAFHGLRLVVGADELPEWRQGLTPPPDDTSYAARMPRRLGAVLAQLRPEVKGILPVPYGPGTPPFARDVDPVVPALWPRGTINMFETGGVFTAIADVASQNVELGLNEHLVRHALDLWLTGGASSDLSAGLLHHIVSASVANIQGGANGGPIDSLWIAIGRLRTHALAAMLMRVKWLQDTGRLTERTAFMAVREAARRFP
jgi:hypothetical protein